ncbi:hypothetical protein N9V35_00710 [bacterium]|nr:hypothetical protein [bacterium]
MLLQRIKVKNFGPYYGENEVDLRTKKDKPINIIYADFGQGKTSLLQAISWGLSPKGFKKNLEKISAEDRKISSDFINKKILYEYKEGISKDNEVYVEIDYQIESQMYTVKTAGLFNIKDLENQGYIGEFISEKTNVFHLNAKSGAEEIDYEDFKNNYFPDNLSQYYYIEGDRFTNLMNREAKNEISSGIKAILDIDIMDEAIKFADDMHSKYETAKNKSGGSSEHLESLNKFIISGKEKIKELEIVIKDDKELIKTFEIELEQHLKHIKAYDKIVKLFKARDDLNKEIDSLNLDLDGATSDFENNVSKKSQYILKKSFEDLIKFIENKEKKNELPKSVNKKLIREILKENICICGDCIDKTKGGNSKKRFDYLNELLKEAPETVAETLMVSIKGKLTEMIGQIPILEKEILRIERQIFDINKNINNKNNDLIKINNEIKESGVDKPPDISVSIERAQTLGEEINKLKNNLPKIESEITSYKEQIEKFEKEIETILKGEEEFEINKKKSELAKLALDFLNKQKINYEYEIREKVESLMFNTWSRFSDTVGKFEIKIDKNFELDVTWSESKGKGFSDLSAGQKQTLAIAFSYSIAKTEESDENRPFVIDAPWNRVDPESQAKCAQVLTELGESVTLILLEKTEWNDETKKALKNKVSNIYKLKYNKNNEIQELGITEIIKD